MKTKTRVRVRARAFARVGASGTTDPRLQWTDVVRVKHVTLNDQGNTETEERDVTLDAFRTQLGNDPNTFQEVRVDKVLSPVAVNTLLATCPAGSRLKYAAMFIQTAIAPVAGSATQEMGIGTTASPAAYLTNATYGAGSHAENMASPAVFTVATSIFLNALTAGALISPTAPTSGQVHCVICYDQPNPLAS